MQGGAQSESSTEPAVISATGNTPRDSRMNLDRKVSGQLFTSKNRVTLLSKSIAEENIYSVLDVHYRSPLSTTNARIAVVEGQAKNALQIRNQESPLISDYLGDLLYSLEETMLIPDSSLEVVLSKLFDEGLDTTLPLLKVIDNESVVFNGLALLAKIT
ncbi:hypothetical protein DH09_00110 (plasmid) [Bacillaceae bacterium JMAK1]|nr:hypothetical protein DH09_00110 [Bacillaceae bacterium JMAK1]